MSIGTGIVLIVIGAILVFALNIDLTWVDLDLVGYILMGAGVVVLVLGLILLTRRRRVDSVSRTLDPVAGERVTERSSRTDDAF